MSDIKARNRSLFAFTAIELIFAVTILLIFVFFGKRFLDISRANKSLLEECKSIDKELHHIISRLSDDLEGIVLLNKNQPIFELTRSDDEKIIQMFFFTTAENDNITTAVKYTIQNIDIGKYHISRTILSAAESIAIQRKMSHSTSFEKLFNDADEKNKSIKVFNIELSDFKVRTALKRYTKTIVFSPTNSPMRYWNGLMEYQIGNRSYKVSGELAFFDVTLRGLTKIDTNRLATLKIQKPNEIKDFIFLNSRKCFGRITPNSENF